jgi:hypothetical protein
MTAMRCPRLSCTFVGEARPAPKEDTMRYLLQIYPDTATGEDLSADEEEAIVGEYLAILQSPSVIGGEWLQPVDTATTVRVQGGRTLLSDGPFVEAKEHLGGYCLVEADELDAALEIAARLPAARLGGAIEVRPIVER